MPVGPYLPGLLQIRPQYTRDPDTDNHPENVLWFENLSSGTPTLANLTTITGVFDPLWADLFQQYGGDGQYLGSQATDFQSNTGLSYSSVGGFTPATGGNGSDSPPNVAVLISMSTGERYRGGHPRIYLPYVGQTSYSGSAYHDKIGATYQTNIGTKFNAMISGMQASGVLGGQRFVILRHRRTPSSAALFPIVDFTVQQLLASQRRRLRKAPHH